MALGRVGLSMAEFGLGWIPQYKDRRDKPFLAKARYAVKSPLDLRQFQPEVYNQYDIGSCVGNAVAGVAECVMSLQGQTPFTPSRLQLYYEGRKAIGTIPVDSGCMIRDVFKFMAKHGAGPESLWPYNPKKFRKQPPKKVYLAGEDHQAISYYAVHESTDGVYGALNDTCPVAVGIVLFPSFMSDETRKTGIVAMPGQNERPIGGHAVVVVGYEKRHWIVRNSWGKEWGDSGYFYLPEDYLEILGSDYWTIRLMEA